MNRNAQNEWITPRRFAVLLALMVCISWPEVLRGLKTFVYRDFGFYCVPVASYLKECLWHLQLPLWNPLNYCGEPFLAQWNTQVLYPPALLYCLLPLPWSLNLFCLLHLFLGGLGMFFLTRDWARTSFGAALAGIVFAFCGLMLGSLLWPATISALAWMPWVVWLTSRAWHEGGRSLVAATIVGALQMLSGGVEVILLTWVLLGAFAIAEFISSGAARIKILIRFCLTVLFISGLCAVQLLPFFDLLRHSQREGNYFAADSPMPPTGWANFLIPLFRCQPNQGNFFQDGQYWILSYYTGIITMALTVLAIWRRPCVKVILSGILSMFCIILAVGNATPVYHWISQHIGIVGLIRFPAKFVILPVFALPVMAAYAFSEKTPGATPVKSSSSKTWLLLWLATIIVISACLFWLHASHTDNAAVISNELVRLAFFTFIIFVLFLIEKFPSPGLRRSLQTLALILVWLDLAYSMPQPSAIRPSVFQPNMKRPLPAPQFGASRAAIPTDVLRELTFATQPDATQDFLAHRFSMFGNCNLLDGIPKCDGFFALDLREHDLLGENLSPSMLDFLGVSEILTVRSNVLDWSPRSTSMPLLTGGQKPIFAGDDATYSALGNTNFNPRAEIYLPSDAQNMITATNTATVTVSPVKISAQEIDASASASGPAILVTAQSYYHSWQAYVDGKPTPLWRANYGFQALSIPAGTHQVKLLYVDWNFRVGAVLSLVTIIAVIIFYWCCPRRPIH